MILLLKGSILLLIGYFSSFAQNIHDVVVSQNFMVELRSISFPELASQLTRTAASFSRLCSGSRYGHRLMTLVLVPPGDRGSDGDELARGEVNCKFWDLIRRGKTEVCFFGSDDPSHNQCSLPQITVWSQHVLLVHDLVTAQGDLLRIWDWISARSGLESAASPSPCFFPDRAVCASI